MFIAEYHHKYGHDNATVATEHEAWLWCAKVMVENFPDIRSEWSKRDVLLALLDGQYGNAARLWAEYYEGEWFEIRAFFIDAPIDAAALTTEIREKLEIVNDNLGLHPEGATP